MDAAGRTGGGEGDSVGGGLRELAVWQGAVGSRGRGIENVRINNENLRTLCN